ncbi:MAG: neutral amino acid transporter [Peltula sp. TS41687]|nr:MAG: neutral amino acid transporter [Peltula sp. TS41687]
MSEGGDSPSRISRTRPVPASSGPSQDDGASFSPRSASRIRATSTARLASPIPASHASSPPTLRQIPLPSQIHNGDSGSGTQTPLAGVEGTGSFVGPGQSALAAAFHGFSGGGTGASSGPGTPPLRPLSPQDAGAALLSSGVHSTYGSVDQRIGPSNGGAAGRNNPLENPEIVRRHLVMPSDTSDRADAQDDVRSSRQPSTSHAAEGSKPAMHESVRNTGHGLDDEFSSLQLQGGDITRQVYRWTEEAEAQSQGRGRGQRSQSFYLLRPSPESEILDINTIKIPGGFRRNYLRRIAHSPSPPRGGTRNPSGEGYSARQTNRRPKLFTNNFIEFLSLYGHFAGEELEEDDEVLGPDEYFSSEPWDESFTGWEQDEEGREPGEGSALLTPGTPGKRRRKRKERSSTGTSSALGAALLLLKGFVGTGVLFLPRAFLNGGMLFSILVLTAVALLSYWCFILLIRTRLKVDGSYGDIGGILYGKWMRSIILFSIVLSQVGFASAYIVFTAENLQAFIMAVSHCRTWIDIKLMVLMQLIIFLPLSLIRDISKLGATALIADFFILLGLVYLYYYDIFTLVRNHGVADIKAFNPKDWTLFIGTAIFTFEGIGLIIPIQETMKRPHQFPPVLAAVMILITAVFLSMGALSYAAYGSATKTVVILNLPQDDKFVNAVQFLYSLAILLSTPLQLFPAIRITENELFTRSGKYNPFIKWQKNLFRFLLVMLCAVIAWGGAADLDKFVALVGSFACVPLVYVYPPLLHLRSVARTRFQRSADIGLSIFGVVVMCYTTVLTLKSWAAKEKGGQKNPANIRLPAARARLLEHLKIPAAQHNDGTAILQAIAEECRYAVTDVIRQVQQQGLKDDQAGYDTPPVWDEAEDAIEQQLPPRRGENTNPMSLDLGQTLSNARKGASGMVQNVKYASLRFASKLTPASTRQGNGNSLIVPALSPVGGTAPVLGGI